MSIILTLAAFFAAYAAFAWIIQRLYRIGSARFWAKVERARLKAKAIWLIHEDEVLYGR